MEAFVRARCLCALVRIWVGVGWRCEAGFGPPVENFTGRSGRCFFCGSFMFFVSVLCLLCLCARLFVCALWSPAGGGLLALVCECHFLGSGVVLDCIDSLSLHPYLLFLLVKCIIKENQSNQITYCDETNRKGL